MHRIESGTVFYFLNHAHDKNDDDSEKLERMHVFGIHDWAGEPGDAKRVRFCSFLSVCELCERVRIVTDVYNTGVIQLFHNTNL